jgi:predicted metal-binding protein
MAKVAIIRCEKNAEKCPMTSCLACLIAAEEGFSGYDSCTPVGVFTCRCPGDRTVELAGILKTKGAEAIHFCTCAFRVEVRTGVDIVERGVL